MTVVTLPSTTTSTSLDALPPEAGPLQRLGAGMRRGVCMLDARLRTMTARPERGAVTVEYAVMLVAGTIFAGVLVAVIKSPTIKTMLTDLVKNALTST